MSSTLDFPPLQQAVLDDATLDQLFADVADCTQVLEVLAKTASRAYTPEHASLTLDDARRLLAEGTVLGVQLRYAYDGAQWWDTLMRTPQGVRLVRVRHDAFSDRVDPTPGNPALDP